ncbi:MAG: chemotaxis protein CheW [Rhodospirillales bacterium]
MLRGTTIADIRKLVTFTVADQLFGISVDKVIDILVPDRIAPIPLAPAHVEGAINVRGKIVTVIDVRTRLNLPPLNAPHQATGLTVENNYGLYTLIVDKVGDVVDLPEDVGADMMSMPDRQWRDIAIGIIKMHEAVVVVMDVDRFLKLS